MPRVCHRCGEEIVPPFDFIWMEIFKVFQQKKVIRWYHRRCWTWNRTRTSRFYMAVRGSNS